MGSDGKTKGGVFQIQIKEPGGKIGKTYSYYMEDDFDDNCPEGWYWDFGDGVSAREHKKFKPGEGILFCNSGNANGHLTYNGQVLVRALSLDLSVGYNTMGNPRATSINIQNMIPVLESGKTSGGGVFQIQVKEQSGKIGKTYSYYLADEFDDDCPEGWYWDFGDGVAARENLVFNPGDGFFLVVTKPNCKLTLVQQAL